MTTQTDSITRSYACAGCECGRVLNVERQSDGTFLLELTAAQEMTVVQEMTAAEVLAEIADAFVFGGAFLVSEWPNELSVVLSEVQVANLREWVER